MARGYSKHETTERKWEAVVVPSPAFQGVVEQRAYQNAVEDNPRFPGEDVCEYLERINRKAREVPLPYKESREVGEEG